MFFKRRSRSNSNTYLDESSPRDRSQSYDQQYHNDKYDRPDSSKHNAQDFDDASEDAEKEMYARQHGPQDAYGSPRGPHPSINGAAHNALPMHNLTSAPAPLNPANALKVETAPDLLTRAFNEALRPQLDKIQQLETQVADMQQWIADLEAQRQEMHEWIDKRGLRPDVPLSIAKSMDTSSSASAQALSTQLDRKITIVNFDLHRLQDDLNSSLSTSHFAAAMLKFIPDIARLSSLPTGPRLGFDLLLKLGGNLNAHGGLDSGDPDDTRARKDFYARLDAAMVDIVRGRFNENEDWPVSREIKRIEKTAQYLKAFGIEPYFPETLELMRHEESFNSPGPARGSTGNLAPQSPIANGTTSPRYH
ncbi:hypothetical protein EJ05DRAFT_506650 [Pseudovirgaria hyperparasitica]|uniref:Uncharacterized protein n=1 Tax=Pseudovirgaria hyperparasitica TaxID=470096 RepID=A0A6A6WLI4_9PEZI|nr:uncharacterized protein EJ05DRAFT_506650 [Pseudovirgaria hyperparasitica]KAF2763006.1 hypothetical protein EJ05DRAFT_506650 [Pseudovirgaria hyperparasitica]